MWRLHNWVDGILDRLEDLLAEAVAVVKDRDTISLFLGGFLKFDGGSSELFILEHDFGKVSGVDGCVDPLLHSVHSPLQFELLVELERLLEIRPLPALIC